MKLTSEEIKNLIFEAAEDDNKSQINESEADSEADKKTDSSNAENAENSEKKDSSNAENPENSENPEKTDSSNAENAENSENSEKKDSSNAENPENPEKKDSSNTENPDKKDETASSVDINTVKKYLLANNWKIDKETNNTITFSLKTEKCKYVLRLNNVVNESKFLALVKTIILEESADPVTGKLYIIHDSNVYGPYELQNFNTYEDLEHDIKATIDELETNNWDGGVSVSETKDESGGTTNNEKQNDASILDIIITAYKKLSEEEQDAFDKIYGEKLLKALKTAGERTNE